ncbi:hypothetical protein [Psychrobacter alimentarius]|uniref:hypothetical protein n=1 Tax=Psychrobacter alimentarius TaxID=261164 RepID=UPI003FD504B0
MSIVSFETKTYKSGALLLESRPNQITIRIHKIGSKHLKECYLPLDLLDDVKQIKNHTALVAYAKANQITDSASDAHIGSDSASVTPCPAPVSTPAKSLEQEQGIFFPRWTLLAETVAEDAIWPYCPFCDEHTNIDRFNQNHGACNPCYDALQNEFEKAVS